MLVNQAAFAGIIQEVLCSGGLCVSMQATGLDR
jgi:hypothetical protein